MDIIAVFVGSGLGAILRWLCQSRWNIENGLPLGTLLVNVAGGFAAGICLAIASRLTGDLRLFLVTGVLGGLTTFSAMTSEIVSMGLRGSWFSAAAYGVGGLVLGAFACWLGYFGASNVVL